MRIIVLGDFHLSPAQPQIADQAMEDINALRPDLVVPLGDFGSDGKIGSPQGIAEAWRHLRKLRAPLRPILGNHDLQQESGGRREPYSMSRELQKTSGGETGSRFLEFENFRLMFVATDPQPADSCWQIQECYVSLPQFRALMETFRQRPGVPVIVFSHAPPLGCGLRTVPKVHVRATNAYLDQNHDPQRWQALYREHAEFVLWFSAHYHLGHDHPDSTTDICGTHFFQTQIHGLQTRDGTRQSRVLDIAPESVVVSTLDHIERRLTRKSQWRFGGPLEMLVRSKAAKISGGCRTEFSIALSDAPLRGCLRAISDDRLLIGTADGFLWEAELSSRSVRGTLHIGPTLASVAVTESEVWRAWDNKIACVPRDDLSRFIRVAQPETLPGCSYEIAENVTALIATAGALFALGTQHVWEYSRHADAFEKAFALPAKPAVGQAAAWRGRTLFSTEDGQLWQHNPSGDWKCVAENVLFWFADEEQIALATRDKISTSDGETQVEYSLPAPLRSDGLLLALPEGKWWLAQGADLRELQRGEITPLESFRAGPLRAWTCCGAGIIAITHDNEIVRKV
jgi:hypothetical protein